MYFLLLRFLLTSLQMRERICQYFDLSFSTNPTWIGRRQRQLSYFIFFQFYLPIVHHSLYRLRSEEWYILFFYRPTEHDKWDAVNTVLKSTNKWNCKLERGHSEIASIPIDSVLVTQNCVHSQLNHQFMLRYRDGDCWIFFVNTEFPYRKSAFSSQQFHTFMVWCRANHPL